MIASLSKSMIGYYVALRISASAVSFWMPLDLHAGPAPIVRASTRTMVGGFDSREVFVLGGRLHVVTLPAGIDVRDNNPGHHLMLPN